MGQVEVHAWLKSRREAGDVEYYTAKEVIKGMQAAGFRHCGLSVYGDLTALSKAGYLEVRGYDPARPWLDFQRRYRVKEQITTALEECKHSA